MRDGSLIGLLHLGRHSRITLDMHEYAI